MFNHPRLAALAFSALLLPTAALAQPATTSALTRMSELGPENARLAQRVGTWDVVLTAWAAPGAPPTTTKAVAERKMVGPILQETITYPPGPAGATFQRLDYLTYNRVQGRWQYLSMDTRVPVGLMPAYSFGRGEEGRITVVFEPFAMPGTGPDVTGQMMSMDQAVIEQGPDRDRKDQRFMLADGTGQLWLANRYDYVRRSAAGTATGGVAVPPPGASGRIDAIKQRGTLRVAVLDEYPWLKQNPGGGGPPFAGPAWRLAEEYASRLGVRLETVPVNFDNKVAVLTSGQVDITIAPLLATPAREKVVDLIVYSMSAQSLFGRADNPKVARAKRIDDLNRPDITIAYIAGSPQGAWLQKRLPKAMRREIAGNLADVPTAEILAGRADVTTIDKFFFTGLAETTPGLASVPKDYLSSQELPIPIGMAIDKNQPAFLAWLRAVAEAIKPQVVAAEAEVKKAGS